MTVQKDLKERLIDDIEKLPAHTKLPSRTELSAQYYVSRQTMDVVINTLCREGYLYALRGAGTYVADPAANIVMGGGLTRRTIGLVLPTYGINISSQLEKGAVEEAARHGLNVVCCVTDHNDRKQMSHLRRLVNSNCAGVLTMAPDGSDGRDMAALLHAARVPVVWLLSKPKSEYAAPVIQYNDISVSTLSVQHLCNQGYRRIGYVCNHISAQPGMPNMGLAAALRMLNLSIDPAWTLQMHATDEIFIEQVARMLSHPNRPDVLTCFNDTVAASVYEAARRAGLRVGADLGVIGKDNSALCDKLSPALSSVETHCDEIARLAVQTLLQYTDFEHPPQAPYCLEPDIVARQSTNR